MALLSKRPLAGFCLLFFAVSFAAGYLPVLVSLIGVVVLGMSALLLFLVRRFRHRWLTLGLCLSVAALSLAHSFLLTDLPRLRAESMTGKRMVLCEVLEEGTSTEYSMDTTVRILNVDGKDTRIKGYLVCDFPLEADVGDRLYAYAEVTEYEEEGKSGIFSRKESGGRLLSVYVADEGQGMIQRLSDQPLSLSMVGSEGGIRMLADQMRDSLRHFLFERLGEEIGALANGFFIGDTSDISWENLRDFRRAGIFHLLSVSGLHLTVLLGAVELFLRTLFVPKKARIVAVSLGGILLLILTGFAASACRSVLMLWLMYVQFMCQEEYDGITALFSSAALILLFSPYAVNDLGFWMSFQATLGLLSVFSVWDGALREIRWFEKRPRILWHSLRAVLSGILLTSAANLFLLPILWAVFGELSWVALICNAAVSPLASAFLIAIPLGILLGGIPLLSDALFWIIGGMGRGLLHVAELFSRFPDGVVSLRYGFVPFIVIPLAVAMVILLLVRLRKTRWLAVPPIAAVLAFIVCLSVQTLFFSKTEAVYLSVEETNEMVALREDAKLVVCDFSFGGTKGSSAVEKAFDSSVATELDGLIMTHLHEGHPTMVSRLSERLLIRDLYLPVPADGEDAKLTQKLISLAEKQGIEVVFYEYGNMTRLWDGMAICVEGITKGESNVLAVTFQGENESLLYLSPNICEYVDKTVLSERIREAETVIFGCHGSPKNEGRVLSLPSYAKTKRILFGSQSLAQIFSVVSYGVECLVPDVGRNVYSFTEVLS